MLCIGGEASGFWLFHPFAARSRRDAADAVTAALVARRLPRPVPVSEHTAALAQLTQKICHQGFQLRHIACLALPDDEYAPASFL